MPFCPKCKCNLKEDIMIRDFDMYDSREDIIDWYLTCDCGANLTVRFKLQGVGEE